MPTSKTVNQHLEYGEGYFNIPSTITIPRFRKSMLKGFPIPFLATTRPIPAGSLRGTDDMGTVLVFDPSITGRYIQTEDYNPGDASTDVVSLFWNDGNLQAETNLRYNHQARVQNICVLGRALIHPYPYNYNTTPPDVYGPDFVRIADGLCMQGSGHHANQVHFYGIPGACLILKNGKGGQGGPFGPLEDGGLGFSNIASYIYMSTSMYGLVSPRSTDTKLDHIYGGGFIKDGIIGGINTILSNSHIAGADRALVAPFPIHASSIYMEASRIGVHLTNSYVDPETGDTINTSGAVNSTIEGLRIGPASNWFRSILCETSGNDITGVTGHVRGEDVTYPDIAGVEFSSASLNSFLRMNVEHLGGATSFILGGHRHVADITTGWNTVEPTGRAVEVRTPVTRCETRIRGNIRGGYVVDMSVSNQHSLDGKHTVFDIRVDMTNGALPVKLAAGKTYADYVGTEFWVDGVKQV